MTNPQAPVDPDRVGRIAQIIVAALIMGVIVFAGFALFTQPERKADAQVLEYLALGAGGMMLVAHAVIPGLLSSAQVKQVLQTNPADLRPPLAGVYITRTVIGDAFLEGAAFFNLVAYMVTGQLANVGMAGFLVVVMALTFPSQIQFDSWVERVRRDHN